MSNFEELYCCVDNFCQKFISLWHQQLIKNGLLKCHCEVPFSFSEVMTTRILFHMSHYHNFKTFYIQYVKQYLKADFPKLVSYTQMLILKQGALIPLCAFLRYERLKPGGLLLLIQLKLPFVTTSGFPVIKYLRVPYNEGKRVRVGFMALNFIWLSMVVVSFSYIFQPKKPSLNLRDCDMVILKRN